LQLFFFSLMQGSSRKCNMEEDLYRKIYRLREILRYIPIHSESMAADWKLYEEVLSYYLWIYSRWVYFTKHCRLQGAWLCLFFTKLVTHSFFFFLFQSYSWSHWRRFNCHGEWNPTFSAPWFALCV
jgi:hypothetical protein